MSLTVSLHCTLGFGNQPLEEHDTRIPPFSGPVMRTRGAEPKPEERGHKREACGLREDDLHYVEEVSRVYPATLFDLSLLSLHVHGLAEVKDHSRKS